MRIQHACMKRLFTEGRYNKESDFLVINPVFIDYTVYCILSSNIYINIYNDGIYIKYTAAFKYYSSLENKKCN